MASGVVRTLPSSMTSPLAVSSRHRDGCTCLPGPAQLSSSLLLCYHCPWADFHSLYSEQGLSYVHAGAAAPRVFSWTEHREKLPASADRLPGPSARVCGSRVRRPARTGVASKEYRGPQQAPSHRKPRFSSKVPANALKVCYSRSVWRPAEHYRGGQQKVPGWPTKSTGVANKKYRGGQQKVPGWPTKSTGVANKKYRGARQGGSGNPLQASGFFAFRGGSLYCYV
jgi:hypothetical protein